MSGFHKRLGAFEISRVEEMICPITLPEGWFGERAPEEMAAALASLPPGYHDPASGMLNISLHTWLLKAHGKTILIDTCVGNHKDRTGIDVFHMLDTPWLARLKAAGVEPEDVDFVMCSHLHADHVGWNTRLENGRWVPTFPNARYIVGHEELEAQQRRVNQPGVHPIELNPYNDSVLPVIEAGLMDGVSGDAEVVPGLSLWPTPGHTPGHMGLCLDSAGDRALFVGDAMHFPLQIPFWHWRTLVDADRDQAAASRGNIVRYCAENGALLMPMHFLAPYACHVREKGGEFLADFSMLE